MNSEQLNSARLARWSQNGEARLTVEAAAEWLGAIGFCSYLPSGPHGVAPSASFLEAVVGRPAQIPSAGERTRAHELLARMVGISAAVPLKLDPLATQQPDSLASSEVLRYIYALRGNRNFKADPSTVGNEKVTPLALHCWKAIKEHGLLDVAALQAILGRDMTEAAIARALQELWTGLYVCPIPCAKGQPAQWELLFRRFPQQVAAGASTGHAEALSAVVSLYLYAVVAATEEEILAFLSPLAPQSKLREVIRGLGSMRQLDIIDIGGRAHLCLQGGLLPEMVAQLSEEQLSPVELNAAGDGIKIEHKPTAQRAPRPASSQDSGEHRFVPKKFVPRKFASKEAGGRELAPKRFNMQASGMQSYSGRDARFARSRPAAGDSSRTQRFRSETRDSRSPANSKGAVRGPGERAGRWEKSGERPGSRPAQRTFSPRPSFQASGFDPAESKPWARKSADSAKPWSAQKSFGAGARPRRGSEQEERPRRWEKSGPRAGAKPGERRPFGKPSGPRSGGAKPWASRGVASRIGSAKSYSKRKGDQPASAKRWGVRSAKTGDGGERPPRRRPSEDSADNKAGATRPNGKSGAKPFWTKNPWGGKGSAAASRSNRPRGGKPGSKKSGRKK